VTRALWALAAVGCGAVDPARQEPPAEVLTLLYQVDAHGEIEPCG